MKLHHRLRAALPLLWPLVWVLAILAVLLGSAVGAALWLLNTDGGTRWLLGRLPGVEASGTRGALLGSSFHADRLRVAWKSGKASLTLTALQGDGLVWHWRPKPGAWVGFSAAQLSAERVVFAAGPASTEPLTLPPSLSLPALLNIDALAIGELVIDALPPLRQLRARVGLGQDGSHFVDGLSADWDRLHVDGNARLSAERPFTLTGALHAAPLADADAFDASLRASGTLDRIQLAATLRGRASAGHAAPAADVQATLLPFAPWPLGALGAETHALDLAALSSALPQTRLDGTAQLQSSARDAPLAATLRISNAAAGRWNEGRLPLQRLTLSVQAQADRRDRVALQSFDLQLTGGRWQGSGEWLGNVLQLDTRLAAVQPQQLDGRAPAMSLTGPLALTLAGVPSPDPAAARPSAPWSAALKGTLDGQLADAPLPVRLALDAQASPNRIELRELRAQAGAALARAQATAQRTDATAPWSLATSGSIADLDPAVWWPGPEGSAWRRGPHRLNGGWQLDLRLPPGAKVQAISGSGTLQLRDSQIAGVATTLDVALSQSGGSATLKAEADVGGNRVVLSGRGNPAGSGDDDQWQLDADAGALASLAPLFRLHPALAPWATTAGSARVGASARGRWPQLRSDGSLQLQQLQAGALALASANARWNVASGGDALGARIDIAGLRLRDQRIDSATAELSGSLRDHKLVATASLPLSMPAEAEQLFGMRPQPMTRALLQADGSWSADAAGGRWRGRVARLAVGGWDGRTLPAEPPANWIDARDLRAEAAFGAERQLLRVDAEAGRMRLADSVALRWDAVHVDLQGAGAGIDAKAEIEPLLVAPLLARAQPGAGWSGDLRVGATLRIQAGERFDADLVLERRDGDLVLRDGGSSQTLGISTLRLALSAHDGDWLFQPQLSGRTLGDVGGTVRARTQPSRRWPAADAPLDGVVEADVANLGVWGTWVPVGWRLGGALHTRAAVSGTFGAPQYTGSLQGRELSVRNLLQGVNITQGTVAVQLAGTTATIDTFSFKGGDGSLRISGGAEFGSKPSATLKLTADHFRLLGRIDRQFTASGSADVLLQSDLLRVDGRFAVDDGLIDASRGDAPGLDEDVTVHRAGQAQQAEDTSEPQRPRRNVAVTVDVDLGRKVHVKGRGLDTRLSGQLRITTPNGRVAVNGVVATESGTYQAYGQKLEIDRGILAFTGPVDNPRLDILALRPNTDTRVGVQITGTTLTPRVRLYAETDMSDTDKLSWLVLGRAPDSLGRTDTALLQRAAVALLSGEGEAPSDRLVKSLGLDEISLRQSDGEVRETVIALGKQIGRRWYVGYERGINATTGTFQLIYRIAQRLTVRAQGGADNSLDIIWIWRWDEAKRAPGP